MSIHVRGGAAIGIKLPANTTCEIHQCARLLSCILIVRRSVALFVTLSLGFEGYGATISVDSFEASVETDNTPGDDLYGVGDVLRVYALVDQPVLAGSEFEVQIDVDGTGTYVDGTDVTLTMVSDGVVSYTDPDTSAVTSATQVFYADYTVAADHDMDTLKVFALVEDSEAITGQYKTATDTDATKTFSSTEPPDDPNNISTVQSTTPTFEIDGIAPTTKPTSASYSVANNTIKISATTLGFK